LTPSAAVFICVITHRVVLELAGGRVAALIVSTVVGSSAVTVLALFNNAVAALLTGNGGYAFVRSQASGLNAVSA
jgi:hypothetical protein